MGFAGRLNSSRWAATRRRVLDHDGWRCRRCGKAGRLEVDHVKPLFHHPELDPFDVNNLQTLCRSCHLRKTFSEFGKKPNDNVVAWQNLIRERLAEGA